MKTVWITALEQSEARAQLVGAQLKRYGLEVAGHFWSDDLEKFAWLDARDEMLKAKADLWLILHTAEAMAKPSVRCGLSLLALSLATARGGALPVMLLGAGGDVPAAESVPTPLAEAALISEATPSWQAKVVAKANLPAPAGGLPYRLGVHAKREWGVWFEAGPAEGEWNGALFGVAGAEIQFQAVGPQGALPERSTLEFPQQGLKLQLGEREYTAWAVRNRIGAEDSYYAKVKGSPEALLFSEYSEEAESEVYRVTLG